MDIIEIAGKTRNFGKPYDWNDERDGPCGSLPIRDEEIAPGVNKMISEWRPNELELEHLKLGAPLQLVVVGTVHPVVSLGVGAVPPRPAEPPQGRFSRIQALMDALEAGPSITLQHETDEKAFEANEAVFQDARRLILDLLGISAKPVGEQIAAALDARARAIARAVDSDAAGDLADMLKFTRWWLPECFPAEDNGQIPIARALCDSLMDAAEAHLKREAERRGDEALQAKADAEAADWARDRED